MKITAKLLKSHGACRYELSVFTKHFPRGTAVTVEATTKALEARLNLYWVAEKFLSRARSAEYNKKCEEANYRYSRRIYEARIWYYRGDISLAEFNVAVEVPAHQYYVECARAFVHLWKEEHS